MESTPRRFRKQVAPMPWSLDRIIETAGDDGASAPRQRIRVFHWQEIAYGRSLGPLKFQIVVHVIVATQRRWARLRSREEYRGVEFHTFDVGALVFAVAAPKVTFTLDASNSLEAEGSER